MVQTSDVVNRNAYTYTSKHRKSSRQILSINLPLNRSVFGFSFQYSLLKMIMFNNNCYALLRTSMNMKKCIRLPPKRHNSYHVCIAPLPLPFFFYVVVVDDAIDTITTDRFVLCAHHRDLSKLCSMYIHYGSIRRTFIHMYTAQI